MSRSLRLAGAVLASLVLTLAGCGDGGSSSDADGAPSAAGKPVTRVSQLEGTWFRRGYEFADRLVGIEVARGSETITFVFAGTGGIREATFPFTLLDGGRIRVTHPQYPTESQVAVIKVGGSSLSLEPETQSQRIGMIAASFDKLSGQSIAQRLEQRIAEIAKEREALKEEIVAFIRQPNLVLLPDGADAARIAIDTSGPEGAIAYQRVGTVVLARRAQIGISAAADGSPIAGLGLGAVVGPPGSSDIARETLRLDPRRGSDGKLMLVATSATIRNDPALHASLKRDYDTLVQARRKIIDAFHDRIGHLLVLQAEPTRPGVTAHEQLAFLRVEGKDAYRVASARSNVQIMPGNFTGTATIQMANDKAHLRTSTHQIVPESDDPNGAFIVSARSGAQRFQTVHRMSDEQLAARHAARTALLERMKGQPLNLVGVYQSSERGLVRPVRFALTSPDAKGLVGTFHSDAVAIQAQVNGDIQESMLGLVFRVAVPRPSPHVVPGGTFTEAGTFTLNLELDGERPVFSGRSHPGDSTNRVTLTVPSAESLAALRQAFLGHLQAGGHFTWDRTGSTGGSDEVLSLALAADGADRVTGTAGFRRDAKAPVVGRLSEADGLLVLDLTVQPATDGTRAVATGPMRLFVFPFGNSFHLSGHSTWAGKTRTRYVSYAPTSP